MAKKVEKTKVGRPKLADDSLRKESWINISACLLVAFVMTMCGSNVLFGSSTGTINTTKLQGNASMIDEEVKPVRIINLETDEVTRVIPFGR